MTTFDRRKPYLNNISNQGKVSAVLGRTAEDRDKYSESCVGRAVKFIDRNRVVYVASLDEMHGYICDVQQFTVNGGHAFGGVQLILTESFDALMERLDRGENQ